MCVEKNPTLGGTCLNVGCIPSKVMRSFPSWTVTMMTTAAHSIKVFYVRMLVSSSVQALLNNSHLYHLAKDDFAKRGIEGEFRWLLQITPSLNSLSLVHAPAVPISRNVCGCLMFRMIVGSSLPSSPTHSGWCQAEPRRDDEAEGWCSERAHHGDSVPL